MGCQRKPQTFALRRNSTRPPVVLPAVCLAGIEPDPSSFTPSRTKDNSSFSPSRTKGCSSSVVDTVVKSLLRTTKPSTKRTLVSFSSSRRVKTATPSKNTASPPFLCSVCNPCSYEKKTVAFSTEKGTPEDEPVSLRWKLSKPPHPRTNAPQAKPSLPALEPRQSSLA